MKRQYNPKYWNGRGKYQKTYNSLHDSGVPSMGKAETKWGEIIRIVSKLYYDIYNNGGGNFDVFKEERKWLAKNMPSSMQKATHRFITPPKRGEIENDNYKRFLDLYVNMAVTHADWLKNLSEIDL